MRDAKFGSDLIIDILRQHGIEYVAFNPGASFRGLHDSLINYSADKNPQWILCCHEEISVAIAHGFAKASGKFMAVFVHANIGLQHASMAIFNAWCDRVPMLIIGGVGPLDTTLRRPWIDWIHTSYNQDNIIRDYIKWGDQPFSLAAVPEALYRACRMTNTDPKAPVYVAIDATFQEQALNTNLNFLDANNYLPPLGGGATIESINKISQLLINANFPIIITDYMGRNFGSIEKLIRLAELLSIPVIDRGGRYNFPNTHLLCLTEAEEDFYHEADLILALDVHDLYSALGYMHSGNYKSYIKSATQVIHVTLADSLISRCANDHHKLYPTLFTVAADSEHMLEALYSTCIAKLTPEHKVKFQKRFAVIASEHVKLRERWQKIACIRADEIPLAVPSVLHTIWGVIRNEDWILTNSGGGETGKWVKKLWSFNRLNSHCGESGGAGLGYGLGASIGAALAHKNSNKLCINLQADGDFLFTPSALWTAVHHEIPLLIIIMNNRSYGNSKEHAVEIANKRNRPIHHANKGTSLTGPEIDFPLMAQAQGMYSIPTITNLELLEKGLHNAIAYIKSKKKSALIDITIQ